MKNEDILKTNNGKKFDIVLMNPPYGNETSHGLYKKFLYKTNEISDKVISVNPAAIFEYPTIRNKERELFNNRYVTVEYIKNDFDASLKDNAIICYFDNNKDKKIIVIGNGTTKEYDKLENVRFDNSEYLEEFENKLKTYLENNDDTLGNHIHFGPKYTGFTRRDLVLYDIPKDKLFVLIYKPNASFKGYLYKSVHKDNKPVEYNEKALNGTSTCFVMFDKDEYNLAQNFIYYINTSFVQLCDKVSRYISKNKIKYLSFPWLDFSKEWTDKELFKMIGMDYDKEEINKIFNEQ